MSKLPYISVWNPQNSKETTGNVKLPHVFLAPVRDDLVSFVHDQLSCNSRQAHGVDKKAGMKHSAESWGTGRAVARIPRVSGSGTHRSGQAAFGNMCRKGRMAHPLQTWRKYHRKVNVRQRRHALASAIAATASFPLVMARGHRCQGVPSLPLVMDNTVSGVSKTAQCVAMLKDFGFGPELARVGASKKLRAGRGKLRGRRYKMRRGVLFVVDDACDNLRRGLRNINGVDVMNVNRLNIRSLAPGGHLGRLCVWTKAAFESLNKHFGSEKRTAETKKGYRLQHNVVTNPDMSGIINSDAIQKVLNDAKPQAKRSKGTKANPLRNRRAMAKLNPYSTVLRSLRMKTQGQKKKVDKAERKKRNVISAKSKLRMNKILAQVDEIVENNTNIYKDQIASMNVKA